MPWDLLFLLLLDILEFTDCFAIPEGICFFLLIDYRAPWVCFFCCYWIFWNLRIASLFQKVSAFSF